MVFPLTNKKDVFFRTKWKKNKYQSSLFNYSNY